MIVNDAVSPSIFDSLCRYRNVYRYSDVMGINEELTDKDYYLYGTGDRAWTLLKELSNRGMRLRGFFESGAKGEKQIMDVPVIAPESISSDDQRPVIISAKTQSIGLQMLEVLSKTEYKGDIYVRGMLPYPDRWGVDPFLMLDMAAREQKKILLCCEEEIGSKWLHSVLSVYGYEVAREVCFEGSKKRGVGDIWSLTGEDPKQSVLLIFAANPTRRADIIDAARELGFTEESGDFAGVQVCCYKREHMAGPLQNEKDNRVPFSLDYSSLGGMPGWAIHGDVEKAENRILVLGGSTSSEVYLSENWASKLQRICEEHGFSTAVYNGAHEMNMALDQLIRLTRGLQSIRPNIVISMSGLNDLNPVLNKFEEHPGENNIEHWRRIESYMKLLAEAEDGAFFAFLQPINTCMRGFSFEEALKYIGESHFNREDSDMDMVSWNDCYYNLIDLFQHREGVLIDQCHYSDAGHEEIARYVFEIIKGSLK